MTVQALFEAVRRGDAELARPLLATGADHRRATAKGETASAIAARNGHTALAERLAGPRA